MRTGHGMKLGMRTVIRRGRAVEIWLWLYPGNSLPAPGRAHLWAFWWLPAASVTVSLPSFISCSIQCPLADGASAFASPEVYDFFYPRVPNSCQAWLYSSVPLPRAPQSWSCSVAQASSSSWSLSPCCPTCGIVAVWSRSPPCLLSSHSTPPS